MTRLRYGLGPIHHVVVAVSDMERSCRFYGEGLGLRRTLDSVTSHDLLERALRVPHGASGRVVYFEGGVKLGQVELIEWRTDELVPARTRSSVMTSGLAILSFETTRDDLKVVYSRVRDLGYECWSEPVVVALDGYGDITFFIVEDPDGVPVEVVALPQHEEIRAARGRPSN